MMHKDNAKDVETTEAEKFAGIVCFISYFVLYSFLWSRVQHDSSVICQSDTMTLHISLFDPTDWIINSGATYNVTFSLSNYNHNLR